MSLSTEQVIDRATDWAHYHKSPSTRSKMDDVLDGLSKDDQRRVYLCGQRIAAGMSPKVIPSANHKEATNAKDHSKTSPAKSGAGGNKKKVSVGVDKQPAKSDTRRTRPVKKK